VRRINSYGCFFEDNLLQVGPALMGQYYMFQLQQGPVLAATGQCSATRATPGNFGQKAWTSPTPQTTTAPPLQAADSGSAAERQEARHSEMFYPAPDLLPLLRGKGTNRGPFWEPDVRIPPKNTYSTPCGCFLKRYNNGVLLEVISPNPSVKD